MDINHLYYLKQYYISRILQNALASQFVRNTSVSYFDTSPHEEYVKEILQLVKPMRLHGKHAKIRLGRMRDGGYVMIDPGQGGIAYSFGINGEVSWDSAMALRHYKIFQYDGTIPAPPKFHQNFHWYRYNVTGDDTPQTGHINVVTIIKELHHENENNIILKMDIENAEFDFFANIETDLMNKFSQIMVELHNITNFSDEAKQKHISVLKKINETHQSIHYHINNVGGIAVFPSCSIGKTLEITFLRRHGNNFTYDFSEYPILGLDYPNNHNYPDIYIGNLEIILARDSTVKLLCNQEDEI